MSEQDSRIFGFETLLSIGGSIITLALSKSSETVFLVGASVVGSFLIGFAFWSRSSVTASQILGPDGKPLSTRRHSHKFWQISAIVGALILTSVIVIRVGYRDLYFPLVRLDRYHGSETSFMKGGTFGLHVGTVEVRLDSQRTTVGYRSIELELSHHSSDKVRIEEVTVLATLVENETKAYAQVYPDNVVPPNIYYARLGRKKTEAVAELHIDGKPAAGIVFIDNSKPFACLHIEFEGEKGLYLATFRIKVVSESGTRKQELVTEQPLYVYIFSDPDLE